MAGSVFVHFLASRLAIDARRAGIEEPFDRVRNRFQNLREAVDINLMNRPPRATVVADGEQHGADSFWQRDLAARKQVGDDGVNTLGCQQSSLLSGASDGIDGLALAQP